ncbi:hypothetical protein [Thermomonospora amylolytica]|uniref:hypothetical protein n=1 Tax=Thermomonospora amylolytica TaxID=1411117 RepID=UPI000E6B931B|nr:hypothetical protein [Thermomonospora amylolytica]
MEVRLIPGAEIREVADRLREVDRRLPTKLRTALRKSAARGIKRVRAEVRALPVAGAPGGTAAAPHKRKQLRRLVARGVRAQASAGGRRRAGLRIVTSMPTEEQAMLPRGLDRGDEGWRHPVFGDREKWVRQPGYSWFREPLADEGPALTRDIRKVLAEAAEWIAEAGD